MKRTGVFAASPEDNEAFHERKRELRQFVRQTRDRLRRIAEQADLLHAAASMQQELKRDSISLDPIIEPAPVLVAKTDCETVERTETPVPVAPCPPDDATKDRLEDNPLQRLSAIKQRLARQIENA